MAFGHLDERFGTVSGHILNVLKIGFIVISYEEVEHRHKTFLIHDTTLF